MILVISLRVECLYLIRVGCWCLCLFRYGEWIMFFRICLLSFRLREKLFISVFLEMFDGECLILFVV